MTVDPKLLEILCCPSTREPVEVLDAARLARLNERIAAGGVTNQGGEAVTEPFAEALVTRDGATIYEVRDDIPIMLIEKGIAASVLEEAG